MSRTTLTEAARLFEESLEYLESFARESRKQIGMTSSACDLVQGRVDMEELRTELDSRSQDLALASAFLEGLQEKSTELQGLYADVAAQIDRCLHQGPSGAADDDDEGFSPSSISPLA
ncbi:hypothetical protein INT08_06380 [Prosthecochloris sp. N3]|uniref:Uncharacterized protein n=1 Tax=Prosthecochloris ethylica TaxID=2743976 RepID=A0ABR9XSE8_9CHLB|nr:MULTISPECIES: hypothetical protein [Prosthecochloris]MEC9487156.1 hypothetical protein [Prosthecochloris sp.]MBF0586850.1 hypothetical protein [Prosthecochloris ethylica]MBF0636802.1 hypothetical protein [Prosthecochloris ethylica]NUK48018.1 hypothetical protein [Prosthecochloris ethylica]RNA64310.1 hypothetical protein CR163_003025 [Prosthecochloris sp. ZM_2]